MAYLTIAVDHALARDLQADQPGDDEFRRLLADLGLRLRQLHPGAGDPEMERWFYATVPDGSDVERALECLRGHSRVVAAYLKPPDGMP